MRQSYEQGPTVAGPAFESIGLNADSIGTSIQGSQSPSTTATLATPEARQEDIAAHHAQKGAFGPLPATVMKDLNTVQGRDGYRDGQIDGIPTRHFAYNFDLTGTPAESSSWEHAQSATISSQFQATGLRGSPHLPAPPAAYKSENVPQKATTEKAKVARQPPLSAPLHPYFRWCSRCEHIKPLRTHHCRHCGTCILSMDHHCPW